MLKSHFVWQVYDKTRVAARGAFPNPLRIDQRDACMGMMFGQAAGGCQTGKAGTNHRIVNLVSAHQASRGYGGGQGGIPAAVLIIVRQMNSAIVHKVLLKPRGFEGADSSAARRRVFAGPDGRSGRSRARHRRYR